MSTKERKIASFLKEWRPGNTLVALMALAVLAVILVPLLRLCMYTVPWWDDYGYAFYVKQGHLDSCTLWDALRGAVHAAVDEWWRWEGTYSAIFLGTLVPLIWGEEFYGLGPAFLILLLTVSVFVVTGVFLRTVLKAQRWTSLVLQAGSTAMILMFIYSAQRGFYWYDGGAFYVAMSSFTMLYIAAMWKLLGAESRRAVLAWKFICILLAFIVGGGNYVTTLQGLLLAGTMLVWVLWQKRTVLFRVLPVMVMSLIGFGMNVLAPGNAVRGNHYVGWGMTPVEAVLNSFVEAGRRFWELTGFRTFAVLILLAPFLWQVVKQTSFRFRYPLLVFLWSVCLYAATFTPALYALGSVVLARMLCTIKITLQLVLLLNECYLLGWFCQKLREKGKETWEGRMHWSFYPLLGAVMLLIFSQESNQAGNYSAYGAYYYIKTGEANNFYQEYLVRLEQLRGEEPNVVVEPYHWRPWFLCAGELSENPDEDQNQTIARWYGKESVVVRDGNSN